MAGCFFLLHESQDEIRFFFTIHAVVAPMDAWFQALFERADLRRNIGHYQRALADFNRLLHARPKHVPSLLGRADVHCKHLQPFQAVQDYSDVLAMNEKGEATPEQALEALKGAVFFVLMISLCAVFCEPFDLLSELNHRYLLVSLLRCGDRTWRSSIKNRRQWRMSAGH